MLIKREKREKSHGARKKSKSMHANKEHECACKNVDNGETVDVNANKVVAISIY